MLKRNAHKSIKLWSTVYKRTSPALCPGRQLLSFHRRDFVFIYHRHLHHLRRHYPSGATLPPYRRGAMYNKSSYSGNFLRGTSFFPQSNDLLNTSFLYSITVLFTFYGVLYMYYVCVCVCVCLLELSIRRLRNKKKKIK